MDIQCVKDLLASEYGIRTEKELAAALANMPKINIGVFVSPVRKDEMNERSA